MIAIAIDQPDYSFTANAVRPDCEPNNNLLRYVGIKNRGLWLEDSAGDCRGADYHDPIVETTVSGAKPCRIRDRM